MLKNGFAIDWYNEDKNILVFTPNIKGNEDSIQYPADPRGECIFFNNGKCDIYKIRPFECKEYIHTDVKEIADKRHVKVKNEWEKSNLLKKYENIIDCQQLNFFDMLCY